MAVYTARAGGDGLGGDDGYYALLVRELLHATGHPRRLNRATTGDYSCEGYELEEGTVLAAQRIVLAEVGFSVEAVDWQAAARGQARSERERPNVPPKERPRSSYPWLGRRDDPRLPDIPET